MIWPITSSARFSSADSGLLSRSSWASVMPWPSWYTSTSRLSRFSLEEKYRPAKGVSSCMPSVTGTRSSSSSAVSPSSFRRPTTANWVLASSWSRPPNWAFISAGIWARIICSRPVTSWAGISKVVAEPSVWGSTPSIGRISSTAFSGTLGMVTPSNAGSLTPFTESRLAKICSMPSWAWAFCMLAARGRLMPSRFSTMLPSMN